MVGSGEIPGDSQLLGQCPSEVRGEVQVSVSDYAVGESEPWVQVLVVEFGNLGSHNHALAREE